MSAVDILPTPVIDPWPPPAVPTPFWRDPKWEREYQAFLHLLPELLPTHRGQYVAVHEGQVVDRDHDLLALASRVHARHGYVPIYMDLVAERPLPPIRVPHYRILSEK
jgi:hypothetical protein